MVVVVVLLSLGVFLWMLFVESLKSEQTDCGCLFDTMLFSITCYDCIVIISSMLSPVRHPGWRVHCTHHLLSDVDGESMQRRRL